MQFYDIFNGDADGICALQQLRLEEPRASVLVTGVKRDIRLLERVQARAGDELTVLDISLAANADELARLLAGGARCRYFDHHAPGNIPAPPQPEDFHRHFTGRLHEPARRPLSRAGGSGRGRWWRRSATTSPRPRCVPRRRSAWRRAISRACGNSGEGINYNAYGETTDDLHYHPADLYETLQALPRSARIHRERADLRGVARRLPRRSRPCACGYGPQLADAKYTVVILPDAAWSRRVHGVFGNRLAQANPGRAHAVLVAEAGRATW